MISFYQDFLIYLSRISNFKKEDWSVYFLWIGLMFGLLGSVSGFLFFGWWNGVNFPLYVWNVPLGIFIFVLAISIDTVGHRTVYKEVLATSGEALVHHITIAAGISGTVLLCLAYTFPEFLRIPAWCLMLLSVFYSIIDESMHWFRYAKGNSDRIEMWSHFFIFVGHSIMVASWLYWFEQGYPGVGETFAVLYPN
jgi:hypothetical protein